MKVSLFVEDGLQQLIFTPQTKAEENFVELIGMISPEDSEKDLLSRKRKNSGFLEHAIRSG